MNDFKNKIQNIINHIAQELSGIRSGRAAPGLVEDVPVEVYGSTVPLKQVASISVPEPRTIAISPWDKQTVGAVSKALEKADLGAMPSVHGEKIHVVLPPLTSERRVQLIKLVGKCIEEGRISVRLAREEAIEDLKNKQKDAAISEDKFFREKEAVEDEIRKANDKLEDARKSKEKELEEV